MHPSGAQYEIERGGLLSRFSMLKLSHIFVLPMVADNTRSVKKKVGSKPFSFTERGQGSPISRIKSALSLASYLQSFHNRKLTPTGNSKYITRCLFHPDKNPSMWVDDSSNLCRCFRPDCEGHTSKPMDILNLHQKLNRCSLGVAIRELAGFCGF